MRSFLTPLPSHSEVSFVSSRPFLHDFIHSHHSYSLISGGRPNAAPLKSFGSQTGTSLGLVLRNATAFTSFILLINLLPRKVLESSRSRPLLHHLCPPESDLGRFWRVRVNGNRCQWQVSPSRDHECAPAVRMRLSSLTRTNDYYGRKGAWSVTCHCTYSNSKFIYFDHSPNISRLILKHFTDWPERNHDTTCALDHIAYDFRILLTISVEGISKFGRDQWLPVELYNALPLMPGQWSRHNTSAEWQSDSLSEPILWLIKQDLSPLIRCGSCK